MPGTRALIRCLKSGREKQRSVAPLMGIVGTDGFRPARLAACPPLLSSHRRKRTIQGHNLMRRTSPCRTPPTSSSTRSNQTVHPDALSSFQMLWARRCTSPGSHGQQRAVHKPSQRRTLRWMTLRLAHLLPLVDNVVDGAEAAGTVAAGDGVRAGHLAQRSKVEQHLVHTGIGRLSTSFLVMAAYLPRFCYEQGARCR